MESLTWTDGAVSRRELLQVATGLGLSLALPGMSARAADRRGTERPRSLITLWMAGGPSQLETWDPHPGSDSGGSTRSIQTRVPGLKIADLFPQFAEEIHALSVIRSMVSKEGDHERGTYMGKTGYRPDTTLIHPALGAIVAREAREDGVEIPQHISLGGGPFASRGGFLGDEYDPFKVYEPGRQLHNLRSPVSSRRQQRRLAGLNVVSRAFRRHRRLAANRTLHQATIQKALKMMSSKQLNAFLLDDESQSIRQAYGDSRFGRGCLVARRLVETGVRAVEVTLPGWDTHTNNFEGHRKQAEVLDPAIAMLVSELGERHLLDSTIVLCIGEFGRTPSVNDLDGRDHWPSGFSCVVGGGGLSSGVVIGETDPTGRAAKPTSPITIGDLHATILHQLGIEHDKEIITPIGRPMAYTDGTPIGRLLSGS